MRDAGYGMRGAGCGMGSDVGRNKQLESLPELRSPWLRCLADVAPLRCSGDDLGDLVPAYVNDSG